MSTTRFVTRVLKTTHPAYPDVLNVLTATAAVAISLAHRSGAPTDFAPMDSLGFNGRASGKCVHFPLYGPVEGLIKIQPPVDISLAIEDLATQPPFTAELEVVGAGLFVDRLVFPSLLNYFEREKARLQQRFSQDRTNWPASWQMAWAVRNATAHGGYAFMKATQKPVSWRGLRFGPADEPARSLLKLLSGADVMLLMLDMADDLP